MTSVCVQGGMGAALLSDPDKIEAVSCCTCQSGTLNLKLFKCTDFFFNVTFGFYPQILKSLVTGVSLPVTCKIRILPSVTHQNFFLKIKYIHKYLYSSYSHYINYIHIPFCFSVLPLKHRRWFYLYHFSLLIWPCRLCPGFSWTTPSVWSGGSRGRVWPPSPSMAGTSNLGSAHLG